MGHTLKNRNELPGIRRSDDLRSRLGLVKQ
jgi:hypothetical protein